MNEHRADESSLKLKYHHPETASINPDLGDGSEYASAENMAALPTNDRKSLLANRYQLQQILGQGGFGRTFLALDRHCFDRLCVVKEFLPQQHGDDEIRKSRELFVREAKILDRIDSAQVPKFFACFEEDRKLFLVQEYIQGQTYDRILRERKQQGQTFSELEVIKWLKDLLPVLGYLHDLQILHRDISLDNVMRHDDSHLPVLIDFGIGRSALIPGQNGSPASDYPTNQSIVGKIGYAPYEQIWLGQSFPSSDLYALAVSAVVMLSGCDLQAFNRRLLLQAEWQLQHSVSHGLVEILDRMLQDNPSHRYQTAAANLADLEQLMPESQATIAPLNSAPTVMRPQLPTATTATGATVPQSLPTVMRPQVPTAIQFSSEFIAQCERESIEYLGPIGKFLVQNAIVKNPQILPADLIELLAQHIPQTRQVDEFRSKLRKCINK
ncbi:serine/threonine protein kinase [Chamaesiphon sp.]|uniref:serine/threonine protein kinase n=1 Tax=Chamaesiphon sp. TaxID=2814140 RepID=UPI003594884C